jgi:hypothetical protein
MLAKKKVKNKHKTILEKTEKGNSISHTQQQGKEYQKMNMR